MSSSQGAVGGQRAPNDDHQLWADTGCGECHKLEYTRMVQCDECDVWYHYECVNVTDGIEHVDWSCKNCGGENHDDSQEQVEQQVLQQQQQQLQQQHRQLQQPQGDQHRQQVTHSTPVKSQTQDDVFKMNRDLVEQLKTMQRILTTERSQHKRQVQQMQQQTDHQFSQQPVKPVHSKAPGYTGAVKKPVKVPQATEVKSNVDNKSQSSKYSKRSAKLREHQLKALEAKQLLERKQLVERLELEQALLEESASEAEDEDTGSDTIAKIKEWLKKTDEMGRESLAPTVLDESPLPNHQSPNQPEMSLTRSHLAARQTVKDLPRFGGDPEDWPRFIAAYERTTRMCAFRNDELLDRLERSLYDRALSAVKSLLLHPENVSTIISRLKTLFGNPEVIVETMIKRIRMMPAPKADKMESIIDFGVAVQNLCATIEACRMEECLYNVALLHELTDLLPPSIKMNWALHRQSKQAVTLKDFSEWIGNLVDAFSKVTVPIVVYRCQKQEKRRNKEEAFLHTHTEATPNSEGKCCLACGGRCTTITDCSAFLEMNTQARWTLIKDNKICRKCLKKHFSTCEVNQPCNEDGCTFLHHPLLHDKFRHRPSRNISSPNTSSSYQGVRAVNTNQHCNTHHCCLGTVLLKYVEVIIYSRQRAVKTYAFIDEGSTCSLMEHSLWEELDVAGEPYPLCISWTGGQNRYENDSVRCAIEISAAQGHPPERNRMTNIHTVKSLQLPAQSIVMDDLCQHYHHLVGLPMDSYKNVRPRILIGMDNVHLARLVDCKEGGDDQPVAAKTPLGWLIYGPCSIGERMEGRIEHNFHICECEALHFAVKDYFSFDSIGIQAPSRPLLSKADERALDILQSNTKLKGHRYETSLLWKFDDVQLPDSQPMALKRFQCLEKRMLREPELAIAMQAKIRDYVEKGYIRELTEEELKASQLRVWYLPIFPVVNVNKPGKLRIVWDAAAMARGTSLNSFLLKGPDQVASLVAVLQRFREFLVAIAADIREMFLQVLMNAIDQHCQRFFWHNGLPGSSLSVYVVQVMTFGATCSPSCAQFVKNTNAQRFESQYPRAVEVIVKDHYVDDLLSSVETEAEALELIRQIQFIHGQAGFDIRGWLSNSRHVSELLKEQPNSDKNLNIDSELATEKVLGMWWNTAADVFTFRLSVKHEQELLEGSRVPTKREILRTLMTIFDPLGLLGNLLMFLKVLLQEIWRSGTEWDEPIGEAQFIKWRIWLKELPKVEDVSIPRCYRIKTSNNVETNKIQLHIFVDASIEGYAAVAYLRFEENGVIECSLVTAKTRVAPLKFVSIPRLELQAAVVGARLAKSIAENHRLKIQERYFWTDSRDVLYWLASDHRRFSQFVGFRVGEILETTEIAEWNWIPSRKNVADDGTKWQRAPDLTPSGRWFRGPEFLWKPKQEWPGPPTDQHVSTVELRRTVNHHSVVEDVIRTENFSSWWRLLRRIVFIRRFPLNIRRKLNGQPKIVGSVTQEELLLAECYAYQCAQRSSYAEEIVILQLASQSDSI
ncbi:uncharacterized protein LOC135710301, partial [Ochlerotatus camptorhynchus]|uniref:uncharacterized protein LOC135710301 n=1 Tax=Ochlerotatus camptorhynchus TaxID=644619 RepID=UPI0031D53428